MKYAERIIDEDLKTYKRKRTRKRAVVTGIVSIILFAALFAAYKIVMTPSRVVQLSLLNTGKEFVKSFEYLTDDSAIGTAKDVLAQGGTTDMTLYLEKSPILEGADADVICVSDGDKTISEIKFNSLMKFETYKDNAGFLANIPLLRNGLRVPLSNFSEDYDNSIFKKKIKINQDSDGKKAIVGVYAAIAAKEFYDTNKNELIDWITSIEFNENGTDKVKRGSVEKNTKVYTAEISKAKIEEFNRLAEDHFNGTGYNARIKSAVNDKLKSFADDYTVDVKVNMYKIREIDIVSSDGTRRVIRLMGKSKPSYDIIYFKEGGGTGVLRRIHTDAGSGADTLTKGGEDIFVIGKDGGKLSVVTNYNGVDIDLKTGNMRVSDDTSKLENVSLTLNDTVTVSGDISMSKRHDDFPEFERERSYIDLLKVDESSWQNIVDVVVSGIQLIKGKP